MTLAYWARADGICPRCGTAYRRGDWVAPVNVDGPYRWVHERCLTEEETT
jgi:hypothetical protein